jgi:hypothetical protein
MSNVPKQQNWRQDLKRWDDEGGAPRSGHRTIREPGPSLPPRAETALYYFNIRTPNSLIEDPEGDICPGLEAAREAALASACGLIAEGDRTGEDRRSWSFEIMDRSNQHVLTVMFSEKSDQKADKPA